MGKIHINVICLLFLVSLSLILCPTAPQAASKSWPKTITLVGPRVGTGSYAVTAGSAALITKYMGIRAVPEASSVGGKTLHILNDKEAEIAVSFDDQAYWAARGQGPYKKYGKMAVRQLWGGPNIPFAMFTREDYGINSLHQLKGEKVLCKYKGNQTYERMMELYLESEGMTYDDLIAMPFGGSTDGANALRERRVKAFINPLPSTGFPGWLKQASVDVPIRVFAPPEEKLISVLSKYAFMAKTELQARYLKEITYNKDIATIGVINSMYCQTDLSDDLVYEIMRTIFGHLEELYTYHRDAKPWTDRPLKSPVVPWHPGAIRYYKEAGLWTDKTESYQKEMLLELGTSR